MKKKNYPTLKEVFIPEAPGAQDSSKFIESMRKQLGRAQDQQTLDHVVDVYDRILATVDSPPEVAQNTLAAEEPFFKFHFRMAFQEVQSGSLDPEAAPSGKSMLESELEKRNVAQASAPQQQRPHDPDAERRAAYGGNLDDPRGLGS